jgi:anti-sigma regulatory factor (Ser/Thr protein kinase)
MLMERTTNATHAHLAEHARSGAPAGERFRHETLFYSGDDGFLRGTLPFINDALTAGEPVLVAVGDAKIELLRRALGHDARRVQFTDMRVLGENPARIIPAWREFLEEHASDGRHARGIGEPVWPGRSPAELTECERHESLLNVAFDGGQAWHLLCPYDVERLDARVLEAARRSHPLIAGENGESRINDAYGGGPTAPGPFDGSLPPPRVRPEELAFDREGLARLRHLLAGWASGLKLGCERTENLVLAVDELASNSVRYGGGGGTLQMWSENETLLVEIRDEGHIEESLVGRTRPTPEQPAGRGLWLVNQLCDLVQIRSSPAGSVVRVHMHLLA